MKKFDFARPVTTAKGQQVTLLTTTGREVRDGKSWPVVGYVGDSITVEFWDAEGIHQGNDAALDLQQLNCLYINLYANGTTGTYYDIAAAKSSAMRVRARLVVPYSIGQCDF